MLGNYFLQFPLQTKMASRSAKRKRCSEIKETLVTELHNLSLKSMDFDTEVQAGIEDFKSFFKSMEDRHS